MDASFQYCTGYDESPVMLLEKAGKHADLPVEIANLEGQLEHGDPTLVAYVFIGREARSHVDEEAGEFRNGELTG